MGHFSSNALDVRVLWASHHVWPAQQKFDGPCYGYALWLMLEGEAAVWGGEEHWHVPQGHIFCWPKDKPRRVVTPEGASWLSLGLEVTTVGENDVLSMLSLPALHKLDATDSDFVASWLRQIVDIRTRLAEATPEHQKVADYFKKVDILSALPTYDSWVNQMVSERPSYLDLVEDGLARAILAWCWNVWGPTDLERALHHHAPLWLKAALDRMHANLNVSVAELAQVAGFSPAQFRRSFHMETGLSPRDYLQKQRLKIAGRLLETTDLSVAAIAAQTGFASVPHFVHLWKQKNGLPPLQYRLAQREARF